MLFDVRGKLVDPLKFLTFEQMSSSKSNEIPLFLMSD